VVGHSSAEIADALGTTVSAVKSALVRGRARLRREREDATAAKTDGVVPSPALEEYVRLFNAGDWDGMRALLAEEVRLDLVSVASRKGKAVGVYFGRYAAEPDVRLTVGTLEGRPVLWAFEPKRSEQPRYFIEIQRRDGRVTSIRDFRYIGYIAAELALTPHRFG
jgi:hypothetical protein